MGGASDGPGEPDLTASLRTYRVNPSVALWVDRPGGCPPVEVRFVNDLGGCLRPLSVIAQGVLTSDCHQFRRAQVSPQLAVLASTPHPQFCPHSLWTEALRCRTRIDLEKGPMTPDEVVSRTTRSISGYLSFSAARGLREASG